MLSLVSLTKVYGTKVLFQDLTHAIPNGEHVGLVGANGAGKTSLLNIITSSDQCDSGGQILTKKGLKLGYLPQEINPNPKETVLDEVLSGHTDLYPLHHERDIVLKQMEENYTQEIYDRYEKIEHEYQRLSGYQLEGDGDQLLKGLGFPMSDLPRNPKEFSGGWRMRMELAKVLVNKPDVLVLDEPTNHLDLPSLLFLEEYLINFKGTLLFVSHDQDLLDKLSKKILYLRDGKISEYTGNFSSFLEQYAIEKEQALSQRQNIEKKIQHNQSFVDRFGAKASKAKQANSRKKSIDRLKSIQDSIEVEGNQKTPNIKISLEKKSGKTPLFIEKATIGYKDPLIKNLTLCVQRGQKIAIIGANGIGKSTLLKSIISQIPTLSGDVKFDENATVGYYAQSQIDQLDIKLSALENVRMANGTLLESDIRGILRSLLFTGNDVVKPVSVMSGGEKSRVGLACLVAKKANFLILDEPTNHLDMVAQERLSDALVDYPGTILFVSHDRRFINKIATHTLGVRHDGKYLLSIGNLNDFLSDAKRIGFEL